MSKIETPQYILDDINREWRQKNGMYENQGQVYHAKDIDKWSSPMRPSSAYKYFVFINEHGGHYSFYYWDESTKQAALDHYKKMGIIEEQLISLSHTEYMQFCKRD